MVQKGKRQSRCCICGYDGPQPLLIKHKFAMLFFIPFPVKTQAFLKCPRCGNFMPVDYNNNSKKEREK